MFCPPWPSRPQRAESGVNTVEIRNRAYYAVAPEGSRTEEGIKASLNVFLVERNWNLVPLGLLILIHKEADTKFTSL